MDKDGTERIRKAVSDLCEPLHDVFARAGATSIFKRVADDVSGATDCSRCAEETNRPDFSGPEYGWFRTHAVRAHAHYYLKQYNLRPWGLTGSHRRNGELWLSDGNYQVRILHGPSDEDVPPPGHNRARRAYYHNQRLFLQGTLFGTPDDRLLILWRLDPKTGAPAFRVVRPVGRWKYGRKAKVDVDFMLPTTAEELAGMGFQPSDENIYLNIPKEEGPDEFGAGGISR